MMRRRSLFQLFAPVFLALFMAAQACSAELAPYKDDLFAYPGVIEQSDGGHRLVIDYDEMRDVNGRDDVPERYVKRNYISLKPKGQEMDLALDTPDGKISFVATGKQQDASIIVVYLHGKGGNRRQGSNDHTFGGNFNRIRNLMVLNGGLYLTPDFSDFGDREIGRAHV